jgi:hypothetical protein
MDTGLVRKGAESCDVVVEGYVDFDEIGDQIFDFLELLDVVLDVLSATHNIHLGVANLIDNVFAIRDNHTGHQATERCDTVTLADTQHRCIDMSRTSLQGTKGVRYGAA